MPKTFQSCTTSPRLGRASRWDTTKTTWADAQTIVAGSAIRADNPELAAARAAGLPVLHRSEALAATMAGHRVVTVAGTHGKSTTTSMIAVLLKEAGLDPSFAIGANVPALGVNAAHGDSDIFVAEADESDGSFLNYRPLIAVVTNVEADHLDHYGTPEAVFASFDDFAALLPADGVLLACADDAGARALAERTASQGTTRVLTYGTSDDAGIRLYDGGPGDVSVAVGGQGPQARVAGSRPAQRPERGSRVRGRRRTWCGTGSRRRSAGPLHRSLAEV